MKEKKMQLLRVEYTSKIFLSILKSMIMIIPLPIIILIVVEIVTLNTVQNTIMDYEDAVFAKVADEMEADYEAAFQTMLDMRTEQKLTEYLREAERNYYREYELVNIMQQNVKRNANIEEIYIYFPGYDYILSSTSSKETREYHKVMCTNSYEEWMEDLTSHTDSKVIIKESVGEGKTLLVSGVGYQSMKPVVLVMKFSNQYMEDQLKSICDKGEDQAWILYEDQILMQNGEQKGETARELLDMYWTEEGKIELDGTVYHLKTREIGAKDLYLVYGEPEGIEYFSVETIKILAVGSVIICFVVLIGAVVMATNRNYAPLKSLFDVLQEGDVTISEMDYKVIEDYVKNVQNQTKQMRKQIQGYEEDVKSLQLGKLLLTDMDQHVTETQIQKWGFSGKYYLVVLYQFVDIEQELEVDGEITTAYRKDILEEYLKEYLKSCTCCYMIERKSKIYCILNGDGEDETDFSERIREGNKEIVENLTKVENLYCDAYISGCFMNLNEIHQGYLAVNHVKKKQITDEQREEISEDNCSIEKVEEEIKANLCDVNLSVASLAELLNITPSYLSRFFKRNTGKGVLEYIHECRIEKAKEIMSQDKEVKAKEVAEQVGFANLATFIRVFKKREGITPGQFRENV